MNRVIGLEQQVTPRHAWSKCPAADPDRRRNLGAGLLRRDNLASSHPDQPAPGATVTTASPGPSVSTGRGPAGVSISVPATKHGGVYWSIDWPAKETVSPMLSAVLEKM
jgi:hypothetical protein